MSDGKSFLERFRQLFEGDKQGDAPLQAEGLVEVDKDGFFFHVACDNCNDHLRLRVTRAYDLERLEGGGYLWLKTIVDGRCFRRMEARVQFDSRYRVVEKEIEGGRFVGREEWEANR